MKNKINRGESGYIPAISLAFISELIWLMLRDHWLFCNLLLIRVKSLHLAYNLKHFTWSLAISPPSLCQSARSHGHTGKNCKSTILFPSLVMFVWCSRLMCFWRPLFLKSRKILAIFCGLSRWEMPFAAKAFSEDSWFLCNYLLKQTRQWRFEVFYLDVDNQTTRESWHIYFCKFKWSIIMLF